MLPVFPENISIGWESKKTLRWETTVKKSSSGVRKAMTNWAYPEIEIECALVGLTDMQALMVQGFICNLYGRLNPFLWRDFEDYHETNVPIANGDGSTTDFQLVRMAGSFNLPVKDIKAGTLSVSVDGVAASVALLDDGAVRFASAPASGSAITASFDYYWRVAFADDETEFDSQFLNIGKSTIKMVTVR